MARTYTGRPKSMAARRAWDAFARAIGSAPLDMTYSIAEQYGACWTATGPGNDVWGYSASWADATNLTNRGLKNY